MRYHEVYVRLLILVSAQHAIRQEEFDSSPKLIARGSPQRASSRATSGHGVSSGPSGANNGRAQRNSPAPQTQISSSLAANQASGPATNLATIPQNNPADQSSIAWLLRSSSSSSGNDGAIIGERRKRQGGKGQSSKNAIPHRRSYADRATAKQMDDPALADQRQKWQQSKQSQQGQRVELPMSALLNLHSDDPQTRRRAQNLIHSRQSRALMTEDQREAARAEARARDADMRAKETAEERQTRLQRQRDYDTARRAKKKKQDETQQSGASGRESQPQTSARKKPRFSPPALNPSSPREQGSQRQSKVGRFTLTHHGSGSESSTERGKSPSRGRTTRQRRGSLSGHMDDHLDSVSNLRTGLRRNASPNSLLLGDAFLPMQLSSTTRQHGQTSIPNSQHDLLAPSLPPLMGPRQGNDWTNPLLDRYGIPGRSPVSELQPLELPSPSFRGSPFQSRVPSPTRPRQRIDSTMPIIHNDLAVLAQSFSRQPSQVTDKRTSSFQGPIPFTSMPSWVTSRQNSGSIDSRLDDRPAFSRLPIPDPYRVAGFTNADPQGTPSLPRVPSAIGTFQSIGAMNTSPRSDLAFSGLPRVPYLPPLPERPPHTGLMGSGLQLDPYSPGLYTTMPHNSRSNQNIGSANPFSAIGQSPISNMAYRQGSPRQFGATNPELGSHQYFQPNALSAQDTYQRIGTSGPYFDNSHGFPPNMPSMPASPQRYGMMGSTLGSGPSLPPNMGSIPGHIQQSSTMNPYFANDYAFQSNRPSPRGSAKRLDLLGPIFLDDEFSPPNTRPVSRTPSPPRQASRLEPSSEQVVGPAVQMPAVQDMPRIPGPRISRMPTIPESPPRPISPTPTNSNTLALTPQDIPNGFHSQGSVVTTRTSPDGTEKRYSSLVTTGQFPTNRPPYQPPTVTQDRIAPFKLVLAPDRTTIRTNGQRGNPLDPASRVPFTRSQTRATYNRVNQQQRDTPSPASSSPSQSTRSDSPPPARARAESWE